MTFRSHLVIVHITVFILGMTGLFAKFIPVSPWTIIAGRSFFTVLSLGLVLLVLRKSFGFGSFRNACILGLSGCVLALHWYTFFHSIQLSSVAIGVIGFSTYPIFVTFIEPLIFKERLKWQDVLSGCLVFLGLLFVVPEFSFSNTDTIALGWSVLAGFTAAMFTMINRKLTRNNYFVTITFYQHIVALLCTLPLVWSFSLWPNVGQLFLLLILGVIFTALPQALLNKSLEVVKAQLISVLIGLEPIYSIIFAVILLNEIPSISTVFGGAIILFAVIFATISHKSY
ncbi:DMT family transporter [Agarilytica rhodophyticola]|uniref:DMT family transporter n=1 Tax=Agarilytica rhodophyticola TaxID=1737490 RepID=UPI000B342412|nr:DMT family transporter [Agarilytica rhodophyticola]